jgi:hypothetical protein
MGAAVSSSALYMMSKYCGVKGGRGEGVEMASVCPVVLCAPCQLNGDL